MFYPTSCEVIWNFTFNSKQLQVLAHAVAASQPLLVAAREELWLEHIWNQREKYVDSDFHLLISTFDLKIA